MALGTVQLVIVLCVGERVCCLVVVRQRECAANRDRVDQISKH